MRNVELTDSGLLKSRHLEEAEDLGSMSSSVHETANGVSNSTTNGTTNGTTHGAPTGAPIGIFSSRLGHEETPLILTIETCHRICRYLCLHCLLDDVLGDWRRAPVERTSLQSLCLTSRVFRLVAQPYLYHRVECIGNGGASLARTLAQRPDLGQCVFQLYMPRSGWRIGTLTANVTEPRVNGSVPHDMDRVPDQGTLELLLSLMPNLEFGSIPLCETDDGRPDRDFRNKVFARLGVLRVAGG